MAAFCGNVKQFANIDASQPSVCHKSLDKPVSHYFPETQQWPFG
jgi:hypothetical protein